jgi:hypothetical protein
MLEKGKLPLFLSYNKYKTIMFKKLWYHFQFWLTGWKSYGWLMKQVIPYIRFTTYYALPSNEAFEQWGALERQGYAALRPGDLIFTVDEFKLSSRVIGNATVKLGDKKPYFVPSHVAVCLFKDRDTAFEIAEMTHLDYTRSTWEDVVRQSTRVVIARCSGWDNHYVAQVVIPTALSFQDRKYDDRFQMGADTLACSELIYFADAQQRLKVSLKPLIGDRPYITPVGLILGENLTIIWDSNAVKTS